MALNEKEIKRVNFLVNKALDRDQPSLDEAEIKELQTILLKIESEKKKAKEGNSKEKLSEIIDASMEINLLQFALEQNKKKDFSFSARLDKLTKEAEAKTKKLEAEAKRLKAENEERAFYADYEKKFGKTL